MQDAANNLIALQQDPNIENRRNLMYEEEARIHCLLQSRKIMLDESSTWH